MSYTLIDLENPASEFSASVWNWTAATAIIRSFEVLEEYELRELMRNASGIKIEEQAAKLIGERIKKEILPKLQPNKRIYSNLEITDAPDDGTFFEHGNENWKNYSANHNWLESLADFMISTKGFEVY